MSNNAEKIKEIVAFIKANPNSIGEEYLNGVFEKVEDYYNEVIEKNDKLITEYKKLYGEYEKLYGDYEHLFTPYGEAVHKLKVTYTEYKKLYDEYNKIVTKHNGIVTEYKKLYYEYEIYKDVAIAWANSWANSIDVEKEYSVYIHILPNNTIYIGQTKQSLKERWQNGRGYKNNNFFDNLIKKFGWNNIDHLLYRSNLTKEEADTIEQDLIKFYSDNEHVTGRVVLNIRHND